MEDTYYAPGELYDGDTLGKAAALFEDEVNRVLKERDDAFKNPLRAWNDETLTRPLFIGIGVKRAGELGATGWFYAPNRYSKSDVFDCLNAALEDFGRTGKGMRYVAAHGYDIMTLFTPEAREACMAHGVIPVPDIHELGDKWPVLHRVLSFRNGLGKGFEYDEAAATSKLSARNRDEYRQEIELDR